jgi:hemin uptake protein HemP
VPPISSPKPEQFVDSDRSGSGQPVPIVDSAELMGGQRELIIRHGAGTYRLRITASNKLILTK